MKKCMIIKSGQKKQKKIEDSLLVESAAKKARFRGEQLVADSVRTAVKTLKK